MMAEKRRHRGYSMQWMGLPVMFREDTCCSLCSQMMWKTENRDIRRIAKDVELVTLMKMKAVCKELQKGPHKI